MLSRGRRTSLRVTTDRGPVGTMQALDENEQDGDDYFGDVGSGGPRAMASSPLPPAFMTNAALSNQPSAEDRVRAWQTGGGPVGGVAAVLTIRTGARRAHGTHLGCTGQDAYNVYDPVLFDIMVINPREFAEQMTLVDMSYFAKIQASELLSLAWTAADKWERAPNVVTFTQRFNNVRGASLCPAPELALTMLLPSLSQRPLQVTMWVCHEVLESVNPRRRAEKLAHFINIAKVCRACAPMHRVGTVADAARSIFAAPHRSPELQRPVEF